VKHKLVGHCKGRGGRKRASPVHRIVRFNRDHGATGTANFCRSPHVRDLLDREQYVMERAGTPLSEEVLRRHTITLGPTVFRELGPSTRCVTSLPDPQRHRETRNQTIQNRLVPHDPIQARSETRTAQTLSVVHQNANHTWAAALSPWREPWNLFPRLCDPAESSQQTLTQREHDARHTPRK